MWCNDNTIQRSTYEITDEHSDTTPFVKFVHEQSHCHTQVEHKNGNGSRGLLYTYLEGIVNNIKRKSAKKRKQRDREKEI